MRYEVDHLTSAGPRPENQDAVSIKRFGLEGVAVAVADGLGGHQGGGVASKLAVDAFAGQAMAGDLRSTALAIHHQIRKLQLEKPDLRSMATTLSAAVFRRGLMEFVHCGDTRIAVARQAGIRKLTVEQTEAQRLLDSGALTKTQFDNYPRKHVLESALGMKGEPKIEVGSFPLMLGDRVFLSSDGFHNKILLRELFALAGRFRHPRGLVERLATEMRGRHTDDNYSLVAVFVVP